MTLRVGLALLAALATGLVLVAWRGFFLQHAVIVAVAVAALVYSAWGTLQNLRELWRRGGPERR